MCIVHVNFKLKRLRLCANFAWLFQTCYAGFCSCCVDICPVSLRATFSTEGAQINPLHGSSSREEVERDMKFFFPVEHTLAVIKPTACYIIIFIVVSSRTFLTSKQVSLVLYPVCSINVYTCICPLCICSAILPRVIIYFVIFGPTLLLLVKDTTYWRPGSSYPFLSGLLFYHIIFKATLEWGMLYLVWQSTAIWEFSIVSRKIGLLIAKGWNSISLLMASLTRKRKELFYSVFAVRKGGDWA